MRNKKLVVLAIISSLTAPMGANADSSNVTVYGRLFPQFNVIKSSGATAAGTTVSNLAPAATGANVPSHNEVDGNSSRIGVRGTEDLGDGLKAIWQVESRVRVDTGNEPLGRRDTFVGLAGGWGAVTYGLQRTPYRLLAGVENFLGISQSSIASTTTIFSSPGLRDNSAAGFHRRQENTVVYNSREIGGVKFGIMYSPDEAKTATKDANLWSAAVAWEAGPLELALGYEIHNDFFGGSKTSGLASGTSSKDTGTRLVAAYTLGNTKISAAVERLSYDESGAAVGGFQTYERDAIGITAIQKIGKVTAQAHYAKGDEGKCSRVGATCSAAGLGATQTTIGAKYAFSKRTEVFTYYTQVENDASATYSMTGLISPGTDFSAVALGIKHDF